MEYETRGFNLKQAIFLKFSRYKFESYCRCLHLKWETEIFSAKGRRTPVIMPTLRCLIKKNKGINK